MRSTHALAFATLFALILPAVTVARSLVSTNDLNPPIANLDPNINVNGVEPDPFEPVNTNVGTPTNTNEDMPVDTLVTQANDNVNGNANAKLDTNANANLNANTGTNAPAQNDNANVAPETASEKTNFKDPAALAPLLLVPLAGVLYLIYEKIAKHNGR